MAKIEVKCRAVVGLAEIDTDICVRTNCDFYQPGARVTIGDGNIKTCTTFPGGNLEGKRRVQRRVRFISFAASIFTGVCKDTLIDD